MQRPKWLFIRCASLIVLLLFIPALQVFFEVDAHNVVPVWVASDKEEYGAYTIRPKITKKLNEFLTPFPPLVRHPHDPKKQGTNPDFESALDTLKIDTEGWGVTTLNDAFSPGTLGGLSVLQIFVSERLSNYGSSRNNPNEVALSDLSPWVRFGQISMQSAALYVKSKGKRHKEGVDAFFLKIDTEGWGVTTLNDAFSPGTLGGLSVLQIFVSERLSNYGSSRNNPNEVALSDLSPWVRFGQISMQSAALYVKSKGKRYKEGVDAFLEEGIVRRELAENFCYYNSHYDSIKGAADWAKKTLDDHRKDVRDYVYTRQQLERARTHDDLWNAAQLQLVHEGKMHGFLRMYWAKKVLEWTNNPETALREVLRLNDRFSLDGNSPGGFVGAMWSVAGVHDRAWAERPVFGKIR